MLAKVIPLVTLAPLGPWSSPHRRNLPSTEGRGRRRSAPPDGRRHPRRRRPGRHHDLALTARHVETHVALDRRASPGAFLSSSPEHRPVSARKPTPAGHGHTGTRHGTCLIRSVPCDVRQALPEVRQLTSQAPQLFHMECRQRGQPVLAARRQLQPDHPMIVTTPHPSQQPCRLGPIHKSHGAVMAQQQLIGDVTDLRPPRIIVPSHCKQQLVLGGGQPGRSRLCLAPMLEATQASAKHQQTSIGVVGQCLLRRRRRAHGSLGPGGATLVVGGGADRTPWCLSPNTPSSRPSRVTAHPMPTLGPTPPASTAGRQSIVLLLRPPTPVRTVVNTSRHTSIVTR